MLDQIAHTPNVCKNIHMPAQSGSTKVLQNMRRGYTREVYDNLIARVREKIPDITISSDFISGFCSETEQDHLETIDLLKKVQYEQAFMFAYSMRDKTHAQYKLTDDVKEEEKLRRLQEVISTFRKYMIARNQQEEGMFHLMLVEGEGRKSTAERPTLTGRTDGNKRCIIGGGSGAGAAGNGDGSSDVGSDDVNAGSGASDRSGAGSLLLLPEYTSVEALTEVLARGGRAPSAPTVTPSTVTSSTVTPSMRGVVPGDYVVVQIDECKGQTLYGHGVGITSLVHFHHAHEALLDRGKWLEIDQGVF